MCVVVEEALVPKLGIEKKKGEGWLDGFIGKREGWIYICRCWWSLQLKVVCEYERCGTVQYTKREERGRMDGRRGVNRGRKEE